MPKLTSSELDLEVRPATGDRWSDVEQLFGPRGACAGCWCMYWRVAAKTFDQQKGEGNRRALKEMVDGGNTPGVIGYVGGKPVAWCAVAPRTEYPRLERSRILQPVDDEPVWSIVCLFVARAFRQQGVSAAMLQAAAEYAASRGAIIVEGYPVEPRTDQMAPAFAWTGIASAFERAGFREVARRSPTRPIMRWSAPA